MSKSEQELKALILHADPKFNLNIVAVPTTLDGTEDEPFVKDYFVKKINLYSSCGRRDWYTKKENDTVQTEPVTVLINREDEELFKTYGDEALEYAFNYFAIGIWKRRQNFLKRKGRSCIQAKEIISCAPFDFRLNGLRHWMDALDPYVDIRRAAEDESELYADIGEKLLEEFWDIEQLLLPFQVQLKIDQLRCEKNLPPLDEEMQQLLKDVAKEEEDDIATMLHEIKVKQEKLEEELITKPKREFLTDLIEEIKDYEPFVYQDKYGNSWGGNPAGYDPPEKYMGIEKKFSSTKPTVPISKKKKETPEQAKEKQDLKRLRRFGQPQKNKIG